MTESPLRSFAIFVIETSLRHSLRHLKFYSSFLSLRMPCHCFRPSDHFPPAEDADPEGLVGFGGELSPEWLLDAYRHGIFPWPITDFEAPLAWWSPDPRAVIEFDRFHVSRRLRRTCRSGKFEVTRDRRFRRRDPRLRDGPRPSQPDLADVRDDRRLHPAAQAGPCP